MCQVLLRLALLASWRAQGEEGSFSPSGQIRINKTFGLFPNSSSSTCSEIACFEDGSAMKTARLAREGVRCWSASPVLRSAKETRLLLSVLLCSSIARHVRGLCWLSCKCWWILYGKVMFFLGNKITAILKRRFLRKNWVCDLPNFTCILNKFQTQKK